MEKYNFFGCEVEVDLETTQSWYAAAKPQRRLYDKEANTRNFRALARKRQLPAFVLEHLDKLGIPPQKATYIQFQCAEEDGTDRYAFSYRIAGNILSGYLPGVDPDDYARLYLVDLDDDAEWPWADLGRCIHEPSPICPPEFPKPHFDLEFYASLPWVLDEPRKEGLDRLHQ